MTTIGNDLTVDGTITANQATRAGEAVVLGDDGLIPASLIASSGDGNVAIQPHFIAITTKSTKISGLTSKTTSSHTSKYACMPSYSEGLQYKYGKICYKYYHVDKSSYSYSYYAAIKLSEHQDALNTMLADLLRDIRTNIRGNVKIRILLTANSLFVYDTDVNTNITDDGVEIPSVSWPTSSTLYSIKDSDSFTSATLEMCVNGLKIPDEGWY